MSGSASFAAAAAFSASFASAAAFADPLTSLSVNGSASLPVNGSANAAAAGSDAGGNPGILSDAGSDSFLFGDNDTIERWTDECLAANTVLRPRRAAQEYKDAFYAFGQQKYIDYMMHNLTAGQHDANLPVGQVLRQCVLSSMYFDEQQTLFATQFVAVVCRRIVERALAYGN